MAKAMAAADRRLLGDSTVAGPYAESLREAFRRGAFHVVAEARLYVRPWEFSPSHLAIPVHVWHGAADRNVPVEAARRLAATIPICRTSVLAKAGHLFIFERAAEIFRAFTSPGNVSG